MRVLAALLTADRSCGGALDEPLSVHFLRRHWPPPSGGALTDHVGLEALLESELAHHERRVVVTRGCPVAAGALECDDASDSDKDDAAVAPVFRCSDESGSAEDE